MKAMILAAGMGSRLGALGEGLPKCLVDINGKTLLEITINTLKRAGLTEFVINTHHQANQVEEYLSAQKGFGLPYHVSHEAELLGTGGGIKAARQYLEDVPFFLVHNADAVHEFPLQQMLALAKNQNFGAALLCAKRETKRYLLFDENDTLVGHENIQTGDKKLIRECQAPLRWAFNGVSCLSNEVFALMESQPERFSLIWTFLELEKRGFSVSPVDIADHFWIDAGTPERIETLSKRMGA